MFSYSNRRLDDSDSHTLEPLKGDVGDLASDLRILEQLGLIDVTVDSSGELPYAPTETGDHDGINDTSPEGSNHS